MEDLVLFGAGGSGREVARMVERINQEKPTWNLLGFIDDNESLWGKALNGYVVLGGTDWIINNREHVYCCCTIGIMKQRVAVCSKLEAANVKFATLIDPTASIGDTVSIGAGCIISEFCIASVNIEIGNYVFINNNTCLGHDDIVGDFTICNPNVIVSGACKIGKRVMIGGMSFLVQLASVGDDAVIAPGSVVYGRVNPNSQVMGNPAKKIDI